MKTIINNIIVKKIAAIIKGTKYENKVFVVGGFVRDLIMNKPSKDIDLLIDGDINAGIDFAEWFCKKEKIFVKNSNPLVYGLYGTAMFNYCGEKIECVAPRSEKYKENSRNPIVSGCSIIDDCFRRDFTINSLFINISSNELIDYSNKGLSDIDDEIIRSTSDPDIIFNDDSLRILRCIRFACKFNFSIEPKTYEGMKKHARRLEIISKERIQDEITKILTGPHKDRGIQMLYEIDAIDLVFPSIRNYVPDIMHIVHSLEIAASDDIATNLAIVVEECFYPEKDLRYLKFSNDIIKACLDIMDNNINELVNNIPKDELHTPQTIVNLRRFQYKCKSYDNMLKHMKYIYSTSSYYHTMQPKMETLKHLTDQMAEKGCNMFGYKLPVDGNFIMEKKNIKAGPMVKQYLDFLLEIAFYNPHLSKEDCEKILELY